jgi:hypothetical protein
MSKTLRVVGSGLGRTGTLSLKHALEKLLGAPCYHMVEVIQHPEHIPLWHAAARGEPVDWEALLEGYVAIVDWPGCAFWPQLAEAFPDARIVHSVRDPEAWWESASQTIFPTLHTPPSDAPPFFGPWRAMVLDLLAGHFGDVDLADREACIAAARRHDAHVRSAAPPERLLVWEAREGWEPLCRTLDLLVPDEPFPRRNTRENFGADIAREARGDG